MDDFKELLDLITDRILAAGGIIHIPVYPDSFDLNINLIGKINNRNYIFAARHNSYESMTNGMIHLYEVQYREDLADATLIIALPEPIMLSQEGTIDYFENDRKISLIWLAANNLQATAQTKADLDFLSLEKSRPIKRRTP